MRRRDRRRDRAARCDQRGAIWCVRSSDWSSQDRAARCDRRGATINETGATGVCDHRTGARGLPTIVELDWSSGFALFSLSLSLSLRKSFEVKIGTEMNFCGQGLFFSVN